MEDHRHGRRMWPTVLVAVLFPVLYVLSVGPVAWVMKTSGVSLHGWVYTAFNLFYVPLVYFADITGTNKLLSDYVNWFLNMRP